MSTISIPTDIGAVAAEVAANQKAAGDPDAKLANAVTTLAGQAKTDVESLESRVTTLEGGGGGSNAPDAVGVECAAVTLGDVPAERFLCAVGGSARTVTGFWFVNMGSSPMTANDTNLLGFTVNCRSADGTITATDYASTGTTGGGLQGVGTVDPLALGAYTFAAALTAPAGGHITVEHSKTGLGKALEAYVMGVYFGAGA